VASEISRARTLTKVNALFGEQEKLALREPSSPVTNDTPNLPSPEVTTGNETTLSPDAMAEAPAPAAPEVGDFPWFWLGAGVVVFVLASAGFTIYRRRQAAQAKAEATSRKNPEDFRPRRYYGDSAAVKTEAVNQDDDTKDQDTSIGRRRYGDSTPATA
jgi:hypothetical protein